MIVLVDNGHGKNTKGKRSPDGRLQEWAYTREIAARLVDELKAKGIDAERIVTEDTDVSLAERVRRVNAVCTKYGAKNVLLVSLHVNAAGTGKEWKSARGWTVWVAKTASAASCRCGRLLYFEAERRGLKGNRSVPASRLWTANFVVLKNTACPAVLTENLFQDNRQDVDYLLSDEGKKAIVDLHVAALLKYVRQ